MRLIPILRIIFFFAGVLCSESAFANIRFIENKGQWEDNILFRADIPSGVLFVESNTITYLLYDVVSVGKMHHREMPEGKINAHAVKMHFGENVSYKTANPVSVIPSGAYSELYNFFLGTNNWAGGVRAYNEIILKNIYPGIDLK
jgi:hypothetical protein